MIGLWIIGILFVAAILIGIGMFLGASAVGRKIIPTKQKEVEDAYLHRGQYSAD